ncbi:MAG: hypothetical protein IJ253_02490 [Bacteroidaceae bacterium]|nr:hypothetical protein [Bacteroidaceae bacterium]
MPKTAPSTLSADGALHLSCPRSWAEMTQEQLRYALHIIGCGMYSPVEGRTHMLLRYTGMKVLRRGRAGWACTVPVTMPDGRRGKHDFWLQTWQVEDFIQQLEYVDSYETMNVRLESIQGFKAVDALLHGVRFYDYLQMEKYYQIYLERKMPEMGLKLAQMLYPGGVTAVDDAELTGCIMWYSYVKKQLARIFPHFFRPAPVAPGKSVNYYEQMNAQIRVLTDGDITKEQAVYDKDCWRALNELDAKAGDAEEWRKKYPKG